VGGVLILNNPPAGRLGRAATVTRVNVLEPAISTPSSSAVTLL